MMTHKGDSESIFFALLSFGYYDFREFHLIHYYFNFIGMYVGFFRTETCVRSEYYARPTW